MNSWVLNNVISMPSWAWPFQEIVSLFDFQNGQEVTETVTFGLQLYNKTTLQMIHFFGSDPSSLSAFSQLQHNIPLNTQDRWTAKRTINQSRIYPPTEA